MPNQLHFSYIATLDKRIRLFCQKDIKYFSFPTFIILFSILMLYSKWISWRN